MTSDTTFPGCPRSIPLSLLQILITLCTTWYRSQCADVISDLFPHLSPPVVCKLLGGKRKRPLSLFPHVSTGLAHNWCPLNVCGGLMFS